MEPIISIKNLSKSYGSKEVLKDISLNINSGQVIGYIGPNGAGKSTTVKILCGLITDFEGDITVNGLDIKSNLLDIKKQIGYIPEFAAMYDVLTPNEYLTLMGTLYKLPKRAIEDRIHNMLDIFDLADHIDQRMNTFSKGMKQKILITGGLMHNPDIIIMDEPLSGLDANSVILVKNLLSKMAKNGKTIFYCSHMMDVVEKVSDRIVLINDGTIIADGSFNELRSNQDNESLEHLFSRLTSGDVESKAGDKFIELMKH